MSDNNSSAGEEWRPIPGLEGKYEASDQGAIRSLDRVMDDGRGRTRLYKGRVLRPNKDRDGYLRVGIGGRTRRVHTLVLEAFVGPPPEGMLTRHLNGVPGDCRLANLIYGTPSENNFDKNRHGTQHNCIKTHCPQGHPYSGANLRVDKRNRRICRACQSVTNRAYRLQQREVSA